MKYYVSAVSVLIMLILLLPGCAKTITPEESELCKLVVGRITPFVHNYYMDHWECPRTYSQMLNAGMQPLINPFTNEPMVDTGTTEFDPEKSPGNFHYAPVINNDGLVTNFSIYIFGRKRMIWHARPSPNAAR